MNHQLQTTNARKGFTLIELLVVMTITVMLASFSTFSFNNVKMKARDAKRKQDMKAMQAALFLYSRDHNGIYPSCPGASQGPLACDLAYPTIANLAPTYITQIPIEPGLKSNSGASGSLTALRYHYYGTDGAGDFSCNNNYSCTNFVVAACLENSRDPEKNSTLGYCSGGAASYSLSAPN